MRPSKDEVLAFLKPEPITEEEMSGLEKLEPGDYEIHSERLNMILAECDGKIIAWASAGTHIFETGGISPGGMIATAKSRYDEFEKEWLKKKPPEDQLTNYGSWPDAKMVTPIIRI